MDVEIFKLTDVSRTTCALVKVMTYEPCKQFGVRNAKEIITAKAIISILTLVCQIAHFFLLLFTTYKKYSATQNNNRILF